jgi:RNA polymerase sigma-70 factor (ECF subfamily)
MIDAEMRGAWDVVVAKLRSFVGRRVSASDVDDVVQDVLLRIHTRAAGVDDARFGGWVYAVARNAITDHYRKRPPPPPAVPGERDGDGDGDDDDERVLLQCVAPFIARLPSPYREAITLVELEGLTQQAAADACGVSLSGMKSRVQRGRRMLRARFEECCALTVDARGKVVDARARAPCGCDGPERAC